MTIISCSVPSIKRRTTNWSTLFGKDGDIQYTSHNVMCVCMYQFFGLTKLLLRSYQVQKNIIYGHQYRMGNDRAPCCGIPGSACSWRGAGPRRRVQARRGGSGWEVDAGGRKGPGQTASSGSVTDSFQPQLRVSGRHHHHTRMYSRTCRQLYFCTVTVNLSVISLRVLTTIIVTCHCILSYYFVCYTI